MTAFSIPAPDYSDREKDGCPAGPGALLVELIYRGSGDPECNGTVYGAIAESNKDVFSDSKFFLAENRFFNGLITLSPLPDFSRADVDTLLSGESVLLWSWKEVGNAYWKDSTKLGLDDGDLSCWVMKRIPELPPTTGINC